MDALRKKTENLLAAFERLSKREKFMVVGVTAGFALFVTLLIGIGINAGLNAKERRIEHRLTRLQSILDLRQKYEEAKQIQASAQDKMRSGRDIQLVSILENQAKQMNIAIGDMQPRPASVDQTTHITEAKVDVNIPKITIDRLIEFLENLEKRSETIQIRTLDINKDFRDPSQLVVKFTVSNFQTMEEKEAASAPEQNPAPRPKK
jgi:hypothetical protein